jgi:hypothetical protein
MEGNLLQKQSKQSRLLSNEVTRLTPVILPNRNLDPGILSFKKLLRRQIILKSKKKQAADYLIIKSSTSNQNQPICLAKR